MIKDLSVSWCIKGADKSTLVTDSWVPLMHHDESDRGSLILQDPDHSKGTHPNMCKGVVCGKVWDVVCEEIFRVLNT